MCGIWGLFGCEYDPKLHKTSFDSIVGRGPDFTIVKTVHKNVVLGFHRLAIVRPGDEPSNQPICYKGQQVVCNGEIYNHEYLKKMSGFDHHDVENGGSDCAAILHSFRFYNGDLQKTCSSLDGVFAFALWDGECLNVGRDPLGVRPLFYGFQNDGSLVFGSEVKCISQLVQKVEYFPPGCCAQIKLSQLINKAPVHIRQYYFVPSIPNLTVDATGAIETIRNLLVDSVHKRLMGNRQFGFMLSGGLDSSLIAAIASQYLTDVKPVAFSVGFEDSPDLEMARKVAEHLGIAHEILIITPEECLAIIPEVIYALETFDPLIIRCGVAHYLLCKHIAKHSDVKVLLSGEGADELFGSYAYMQNAPNTAYLHREIIRRLKHLHQYDVLRCDRATSCHGLEIRVPFLDKKIIDFCARLPPKFKLSSGKMEKYLLRKAFDGWIPHDVLWRSKEGFSEALGKMCLGTIVHDYVDNLISEVKMDSKLSAFPWHCPETKEEYWYRQLFEKYYQVSKMHDVIHQKIYRSAAWQMMDEKENCDKPMLNIEAVRFRRRSTGSAKFSGVA
ncbi:unnamed protein product [Bursaphelenchus okinawaensis]|uniref:Asparagine synthetase [glutamine-hydrolyzing] n=1 Tax=Bursaphelenchus okinawaensis TaxID=465554 RepID=A0A811L8V4_9BILA|nr:unnamed protein product [Bursaphelenchus okinawaensis]CAG9120161.1 unnamed protein product [Bursaphelenchus okinawaensis]